MGMNVNGRKSDMAAQGLQNLRNAQKPEKVDVSGNTDAQEATVAETQGNTVVRTMYIDIDNYGTPHYRYEDDGYANIDAIVHNGEIVQVFDYDNPGSYTIEELNNRKRKYTGLEN